MLFAQLDRLMNFRLYKYSFYDLGYRGIDYTRPKKEYVFYSPHISSMFIDAHIHVRTRAHTQPGERQQQNGR